MPAETSPTSAPSPAATAPTRRERRRAERAAQIEAELTAGNRGAEIATGGRVESDAEEATGSPTSAASPTAAAVAAADRGGTDGAKPASGSAVAAVSEKPTEARQVAGAPTAEDSVAAKATSKAGRNLPAAIGVGLGLGALLLASLFIVKQAFVVLAIVGCLGALWELDKAVRSRDIKLPLLPLAVGTVGMLVSAYSAGIEALLVAFVLTAGGVFIWRVVDGGGAVALREATAGIFAAGYIPFLAGFLTIMLSKDDGSLRVLMLIALVVANDTGGYTAGVLFGRHPMAPTVSPKKSWEGAAGSLILAACVGVGFAHWGLHLQWWVGLVLAAGAVLGAIVGDLAESLLKRDLGIKDMGNLLPGHGGVLDRIDSILLATPVVFALMLVVAPA